jgi:hypothetical protein
VCRKDRLRAISPEANLNEACGSAGFVRLAIPFYGIAGFLGFDKSGCYDGEGYPRFMRRWARIKITIIGIS